MMYPRLVTVFIAVALTAVLAVPYAYCAGGGRSIGDVAAELNAENFADSFEVMKASPSAAVRALMDELVVVDEAYIQVQDRGDMHVVWCIRMLRALTGLDFTAMTRHVFGPGEEQRESWLRQKDMQSVPFFAVMTSTDVVFLAPADAQSEIIWQWSNWFGSYGLKHDYSTKLPTEDKWYY